MRKVKGANLSLHLLVAHTGSLHGFHVVGVNVRMLSFDMLLHRNPVIVKIDNELEELVFVVASFDDNLDPGITSRDLSHGLPVVLLLEVGDHLFLGRLPQGNDSKVRVLAPKMRADNLGSLEIASGSAHAREEMTTARDRKIDG